MLKKQKGRLLKLLSVILAVTILGGTGAVLKFYPLRYPALIFEYSKKYDLPPEIVCSVIRAESGFKEEATSSAGAKGLMQLMEDTADWAADEIGIEGYSYENITDPEINIELGCWLLSRLMDKYNGDFDTALCAYNAGSGNVDKWLDSDSSLSNIPFSETEAYVSKVKKHTAAYRFILTIIGGKYNA